MILNILISVIGFVVLIKSADFFVDGASSFAKNLKIPTAVIGLTIVAFGTSAPELAVSFNSHLSGNIDMMYGNVIGSNIANILMVLGVSSLIVPLSIQKNVIKKEIPILMMMTLGFSFLFLDSVFHSEQVNTLSRADGLVLILFFAVFVFYLISVLSKDKKKEPDEERKPKYKTLWSVLLFIGGLTGVVLSSNLIVDNVAALAEKIGISQKIISVTAVAIGTSLPELVTTITASRKGENNIAIGNIVGSSIFNICIVLSLPVIILGDATSAAYHIADIAFLILPVMFLWVFSATGKVLKKLEGGGFLILYCVYNGYVLLL